MPGGSIQQVFTSVKNVCSFIQYPQDPPGTMVVYWIYSFFGCHGIWIKILRLLRVVGIGPGNEEFNGCHGHKLLQDGRLSDFPWLGMLRNSQQSDPSLGSRVQNAHRRSWQKMKLREQVCIPQMVVHSEAHGLGSCQLSDSFFMEYARGGLSPSRDKAEERLSTPVLVHF